MLDQLANGIAMGSVYVLAALGLALIFGTLDVANLAQGALITVGAFGGMAAARFLDVPFVPTILVGAVLAGLISVLIELLLLRPIRRNRLGAASEFAPLIMTLAAGTVLTAIIQIVSKAEIYTFPSYPTLMARQTWGGINTTVLQILMLLTGLVLALLILVLLRRTRAGVRLRAVAADTGAAALLGVPTNRYFLVVFFVSGALAGICGVLLGIAFGSVTFLMGEPYLLIAFAIVTVGGLGSVRGAIIVALVVGIIETLIRVWLGGSYASLAIYSVLFAALIIKPSGLFGEPHIAMAAERR